jgi:hypothetical protein
MSMQRRPAVLRGAANSESRRNPSPDALPTAPAVGFSSLST